MRILSLVVLGLMMVASSAYAQGNDSTPRNFGMVTCRQHIACPDGTGGYMSASDLAANATQCVSSYFSLNSGAGFFDTSAGLDNNQCLTSLAKQGELAPRCCVIKLPDNSCTFHCVLSR